MRPECHVVRQLAIAGGLWTLHDRTTRVHERPVVGDPELGQYPQRNRDVWAMVAHVGERQHYVIDRAKQGDLVAGHLCVVLDDGAENVPWRCHCNCCSYLIEGARVLERSL